MTETRDEVPDDRQDSGSFSSETRPDESLQGKESGASGWSQCRRPRDRFSVVTMAHGGGGQMTQDLLDDIFLPALGNSTLNQLVDSSVLARPGGRIAFSTDSYVVQPLVFPGGSIGDLAVHGTVNDLAMSGAVPIGLSVAFILEEGLSLSLLRRIVNDMAAAARDVGIEILTGDTKVVERGHGDGCYVNTSGIGVVPDGIDLGANRIQVGDAVLVSGTVGDHGMAIMSCREGLEFDSTIRSDTAALNLLAAGMLGSGMLGAGAGIRMFRDPTRGGVAATLNEIAAQCKLGIELENSSIPIRSEVSAACEILGLDPLQVANEGKLVCIVDARDVDRVLAVMKTFDTGEDACLIGHVVAEHPGRVVVRTEIGGKRILPMPLGEQLPRIC